MLAGGERAIVAIQWANSETGVRQPIAELAAIVHAAGGLLLVDAAQMPAGADAAPIDHADFVVVSAHQRGGPPGAGDRKSVVRGKSGYVRVDHGGRRLMKKKKKTRNKHTNNTNP